jgi:hypothetical protein
LTRLRRNAVQNARFSEAIASMGRHVLKTPPRTPQANAFCERLIGTMRRECLLREWVRHSNRGRPHASLGPGIPHPSPEADQLVLTGDRLPEHTEVIAAPILGGLHHEYRLARRAA